VNWNCHSGTTKNTEGIKKHKKLLLCVLSNFAFFVVNFPRQYDWIDSRPIDCNPMVTVIVLFFVTCFLAYSNGANDNFKGVATLSPPRSGRLNLARRFNACHYPNFFNPPRQGQNIVARGGAKRSPWNASPNIRKPCKGEIAIDLLHPYRAMALN
jgi:hypothetical protein